MLPWMRTTGSCIAWCTVISTIAIIPHHRRLKCEWKTLMQAALSIFGWHTIYTLIWMTASIRSILLMGWCAKIYTMTKRWATIWHTANGKKTTLIKMITFEIVYKFEWLNGCYDLVNSFSLEIRMNELLK